MKKGVITVCLVLVTVVLIVSEAFSQTTKTAIPAGEPIKIGGSLPLTGIASEQAKWVKAGYEWWAEDVNSRGGLLGRPVKLIIYDDESNAEKSVTYYEGPSPSIRSTWFLAATPAHPTWRSCP